MSADPIGLPEPLKAHADLLVQSAHASVAVPAGPSFDLVTSWCEANAESNGLLTAEHGDSFPCAWLDQELARLDVLEICNRMGVDEDEAQTEGALVAAIRQHLAAIFDFEDLPEDLPYACDVIVSGADGRAASLCFYLTGGDSVMASPDIEWVGVYRTLEEFRESIRSEGAVTSQEEAAAISNARLVERWREIHRQGPTRSET
jgi:hypothetical protein